ncbi:MAG: polysaccharide deacetylase [Caulobacterales bacterium 68-7]|nr:MAG: polysaccharide deacetylase [Caulobacterales bacterium 68-7]
MNAMSYADSYQPDRTLKGKLRRRLVRLAYRRPARVVLAQPMLSISFDDAPVSAVETGARLLEERGLRGTYYISAGLAGKDGPMGRNADGEQIAALAAAGHDIADHTYSHLDCGQASRSEVVDEADLNAEMLTGWAGVEPSSFAYPYGDVAIPAKHALSERFRLLRALHHGVVATGSDLNQAPAVGIEGPDGEAVARRWMAEAKARNAWLILYTHDVAAEPSPWGCTPDALARLLDTALADGFEVVTVAQGVRRIGA